MAASDTSQARYIALIASLADGIAVLDHELKVTDVNQVFTDIVGYGANDLIGRRIREVITMTRLDGSSLPRLSDAHTKLAHAEGPISDTYIWTRADGAKLTVESLSSPFKLRNKLAGSIVRIRDVSEQTAIDSAKTEFVSLAAHQLRTPLSSVNWYLEMLAEDKTGQLSKQQKDYMTELRLANQRMVTLVNDLLNVSRIDLGNFSIKPEITDIEQIINTILNELSIQITDKNMHITTAFTGAVNSYRIDPQLATIVLQNLIGNAVKYTPAGGSIDIYAILDHQKLLITIDDTGYGIPASQQSKIFNKLFRADNVLRRDTDGTGLGLYMVKAIVEKSGGIIEFTSRLNRGSTFSVTFPAGGMKRQPGGLQLAPAKKL